ncbi:MAG: hypothetical protein ACPGJU_01090 [Coraliomargarita sp.]
MSYFQNKTENYRKNADILSCMALKMNPATRKPVAQLEELFTTENTQALAQAAKVLLESYNDSYSADTYNPQQPERRGDAWTENEEAQLIQEFDGGVNLNRIAYAHRRTLLSVYGRLIKLGKIVEVKQANQSIK